MDMSGRLHAPESVTVGRGAASNPGQGGESVINISPLRRYSRSGRSRRRGSTGSPSNDPLADPELEHMRSILQQMANSHDIPEEWWISAGLTPTIAQTSNSARTEANEDVSGNGTEI